MPIMDGYDATREIRKHEQTGARAGSRGVLPIIALTANALNGDRERCLKAGMTDYLSKPLAPETLLQMIETYALRKPQTDPVEAAPAEAGPVVAQMPGEERSSRSKLGFETLLHRCGGKRDFVEQVLAEFRTHSLALLSELVSAHSRRDIDTAGRRVHTLKGMAATMSADGVRELAAEAEKCLRRVDWDGAEKELNRLQSEIDHWCLAISETLAQAQYSEVERVES
jgi:HPt (histidine-containing phosphotransfer) domain-containing protein